MGAWTTQAPVLMTMAILKYRKPNECVIKTDDPQRLVRLLEQLGLTFEQEQHGDGPVHWASEKDGFLLEVYPPSTKENQAATHKLLEVDHAKCVKDSHCLECCYKYHEK